MRCEEIAVLNSNGEPFNIDLRYHESNKFFDYKNFVIICPGFMAFKDWGPFPYIGEKIADFHFATIVMNYSHNGINENRYKITNFKKFFENTISKELDDIESVLSWLYGNFKKSDKDNKIILMGHSRGAANSILIAANSKVNGIITISPIANYDRWNDHQKSLWRSKGYLPLSSESSNSILKIGIEYLNDLENNRDKYDLESSAAKLKIPWLIIHGENDLVAKIDEAEKLYNLSNKNLTDLFIIPNMGHLLGYNQYPDNQKNIFINKIITIIKEWLNKNFRSENE